ncbi:MAG: FAD-binding oxidoreductase [Verrucomicrobia bacterium]|nr:FAD-binding oxidoreductase [Verrucomicrobiota bacterium]
MRPDVCILGQGLAGTLLAWELERAGIPFVMVDAGHASASSRVAAGIINPITGRRLVKSWRIDALRPLAEATYRALEAELGVSVWRAMRVRRLFRDERERRIFREKQARGELAPFAGDSDDSGFWIGGAARVDTGVLLTAARARWRAKGWLREERAEVATALAAHGLVIDCTGATGARGGGVPWKFSKGEILTLATDGLDPEVIVNSGHWLLPVGPGEAKVGATHEPGATDATPTAAARALLEASARELGAKDFRVTAHEAGVRVNLPDKHPVAGRWPGDPRHGVINGLGAKGALLAPLLARQWLNHLTEGVAFDAAIDVARFAPVGRI